MEITSHVCHKSVIYFVSFIARNEFHRYVKTVKTVVVFISIRQVNASVNMNLFQHLGDTEINDLKQVK